VPDARVGARSAAVDAPGHRVGRRATNTRTHARDGPVTGRVSGSADLPVYIRVTQADGNQAWTSPIYLIA